jgi:hypothetical protein
MSLPIETFQDRAARRRAPKALREGRDAINDVLRRGRPTLEERHAERVMQEFEQREQALDERITGLDQGGRGGGHTPGAHAPEPTSVNDHLRASLRELREGSQ